MPIYQYKCPACDVVKEQYAFNGLQPDEPVCYPCVLPMERIISAPARVMFGPVHTKIEIVEDPLYKGPDEA